MAEGLGARDSGLVDESRSNGFLEATELFFPQRPLATSRGGSWLHGEFKLGFQLRKRSECNRQVLQELFAGSARSPFSDVRRDGNVSGRPEISQPLTSPQPRALAPFPYPRRRLFVQHTNIRQIPIILGKVQPVPYYELVGNLKAYVGHVHWAQTPLWFV